MTDEQTTEQAPKLGLRLKQAREAKGLTVEEAAERLNLRVVNIEDMESERFDSELSTTFTRGYVKQYAKLLDIPADEAIAALDELHSVTPEPTKLHSFSQKVSKQASDDRLMMLSYVILAVIIGLVVLWWVQKSNTDKTVGAALPETLLESGSEASSQPEAREVQTDEQSDNPTDTEMSTSRPEPVELTRVESADSQSVDRESQGSEPTRSDTLPEARLERDEGPEQPAVTEPSDNTVVDTEPETSSSDGPELADSVVSSESATQAVSDESDVSHVEAVFEFSGDCWVNIVDATGEAIAYGIKKAGRTMPVSGVPPFEVTLGAPETVSLTFDGEPVDMSDFRSGRTARFTLPRQ